MYHDSVEDDVLLVLKNDRWATLMWPLIQTDDPVTGLTRYQPDLSEDLCVRYKCLYDLESWKVIPVTPKWCPEIGFHLCKSGFPDTLIRSSLRVHSAAFTHADLVFLAEFFGIMDRPDKKNRKDLLAALVEYFAGTDPEFAALVLEEKPAELQRGSVLDEWLLENLDESERMEFSCLKPKSTQDKEMKRKQWNKLYSEKVAETKVADD